MAEAPKCRNKTKAGVTVSDEVKQIEEADQAFLKCIIEGDLAAVKACLDAGQEVNVGNENCESAMHLAVKYAENSEIIKVLIDRGAYVAFEDEYGKQPISVCIEVCVEDDDAWPTWEKIFDMIATKKDAAGQPEVDLTRKHPSTGNSLLHSAAWFGRAKIGKKLIDTKLFEGKLEETNKEGQTAMHVAAFRAPKSFVELLVASGANHQAIERNGRRISKDTPLMMATAMGKGETAKYFKELDAAVSSIQFYTKLKIEKRKREALGRAH